jgi:hypothetical protein
LPARRKGNARKALAASPPEPLAQTLARESQNGPTASPSTAPLDADLARVVDAWPTLPAAIRAGVLALVNAATANDSR